MKEEILDLEADFANNEYFGTNVWTEEKYRVLSGNRRILLSAPHAVNQIRGDDVRDAEKYTGALVRYLSGATGCYAIFQLFTHADPNNDINNDYKNAVINLITAFNFKLLLDIHSSSFIDETDVDIVTNNRETLCGMDDLFDQFKKIGIKYNVTVDEKNKPNKEMKNEIITVSSLICGIPSIRIVINNKRLEVLNTNNKIKDIINVIEEFIQNFKV